MNKKIFILVSFSLLALSSCGSKVSKEIELIISGFSCSKALKYAQTVEYFKHEEFLDTKYYSPGINETHTYIDQNENDLYYYNVSTYSGTFISNKIEKEELLVAKEENEYVSYKKNNLSETVTRSVITSTDAKNTIYTLFYTSDTGGAYYYGGIYFGDYFRSKKDRVGEGYKLNDDKTILSSKLAEQDSIIINSETIKNLDYSETNIDTTYGLLTTYEASKKTVDEEITFLHSTANAKYNLSIDRKKTL